MFGEDDGDCWIGDEELKWSAHPEIHLHLDVFIIVEMYFFLSSEKKRGRKKIVGQRLRLNRKKNVIFVLSSYLLCKYPYHAIAHRKFTQAFAISFSLFLGNIYPLTSMYTLSLVWNFCTPSMHTHIVQTLCKWSSVSQRQNWIFAIFVN